MLTNEAPRTLSVGKRTSNQDFTSETSLAYFGLSQPDNGAPLIVRTYGDDAKYVPLTFSTIGQKNGLKLLGGETHEYIWHVLNRQSNIDFVVGSDYTTGDKAGLNGSDFVVYFKSKFFKRDWTIATMHPTLGWIRARVMEEPKPAGTNKWRYVLRLWNVSAGHYCDLAFLQNNWKWVSLGLPSVTLSHSDTNLFNARTFGKRMNMIGAFRMGRGISGAMASAKLPKNIYLPDGKGGWNTKWENWEAYNFELDFQRRREESLIFSEFNRLPDGSYQMLDQDNGLPVPAGAGIWEICKQSNYDTYGYAISPKRFKEMFGDLYMYHAGKEANKVVMIYTGWGGFEDASEGILAEALSYGDGFLTKLGEEYIRANTYTTPNGGSFTKINGLILGGSFTAYKDLLGNVYCFQHLPALDYGGLSEVGVLHPRSKRSLLSHSYLFVDQYTTQDQEGKDRLNMQFYAQEGRVMIKAIHPGVTPLPDTWKSGFNMAGETMIAATTKDEAQLMYFGTGGINIADDSRCGLIECSAS